MCLRPWVVALCTAFALLALPFALMSDAPTPGPAGMPPHDDAAWHAVAVVGARLWLAGMVGAGAGAALLSERLLKDHPALPAILLLAGLALPAALLSLWGAWQV